MTATAKSAGSGVRMHETRNGTETNAKKVSMVALQARLADGIDLAADVKQAHWNLKGPQFIGVHLMLDGFRTELDDFNDKVAERLSSSAERLVERCRLSPARHGCQPIRSTFTILETI